MFNIYVHFKNVFISVKKYLIIRVASFDRINVLKKGNIRLKRFQRLSLLSFMNRILKIQ